MDVVPKMVQALLRQLETVPLGQKTEVGVLHLAVSLGVLWEHSSPPPDPTLTPDCMMTSD